MNQNSRSTVWVDIIKGIDTFTPHLRQMRSLVDGLGQGFGAALAFTGVQGVVSQIQGLNSAIQQAASTQTQALATASDLGQRLGVSFGDAQKLVADTQKQISNIAASLPGVNSQYQAILDGITATVGKFAQGDTNTFKDIALDLTKRAGVLAAIRQVNANDAGSALNRLLAGTVGFQEAVGTLDLFQKNPQFIDALKQQAELLKVNVTDWKKLSDQTRLQIVQQALKVSTPDSLLGQFTNTVDSQLQTIQASLFDQRTGLFGWLRELPKLGNRTGLDSVQGFLTAFTDFSKTLGKAVNRLGLTFDPMEGISRFIDQVSNIFGFFDTMLKFPELEFAKVFQDFFNPEQLGRSISDVVNRLASALDSINWNQVSRNIIIVLDSAWDSLAVAMRDIDWGIVSRALGKITVSAIGLLAASIPSGLIGQVKLFVAFFQGIGEAIGRGLKDIGSDFVRDINDTWDGFIKTIKDAVTGLVPNLSGGTNLVGTVVKGAQEVTKVGQGLLNPSSDQNQKSDKQASVFSPTLQFSVPSGDPATIAREVLAQLNQMYQDFQGGLA